MGNASGRRTNETYFELHNDTHQTIINTETYGIDNYDWDINSNARPDNNLRGHRIPPNGSIRRREEVHAPARNCAFKMKLTFSDGTVDDFRIWQKHAIGDASGFTTYNKCHDISHNRSGHNTLVVRVKNTAQQLQNEKAEEKNNEGEAMMKNQQYEAAMKMFDVALSLANQSSTINSIKKNKSEACTQIGMTDFKDGFVLEKQDKPDEAKNKFEKAEKMFQQATNLNNSSGCQQNSKIFALKIEGNNLFNQGNDLEKKASTMSDGDNYSEAQNKYNEALDKYEKAAQKFEEGDKKDASFADSIKVTKEVIESVKKAISEIDKTKLKIMLNDVHVDEEKQEEETSEIIINTNFKEHVDVPTD